MTEPIDEEREPLEPFFTEGEEASLDALLGPEDDSEEITLPSSRPALEELVRIAKQAARPRRPQQLVGYGFFSRSTSGTSTSRRWRMTPADCFRLQRLYVWGEDVRITSLSVGGDNQLVSEMPGALLFTPVSSVEFLEQYAKNVDVWGPVVRLLLNDLPHQPHLPVALDFPTITPSEPIEVTWTGRVDALLACGAELLPEGRGEVRKHGSSEASDSDPAGTRDPDPGPPLSESPDEPLERKVLGQSIFFARTVYVLCGKLPPRFDGFVGVQCLGIFRPLEVEVVQCGSFQGESEGRAVVKVGSVTVQPGGRCRLPHPKAVEVGDWLALRMENPSEDPASFRVLLHGHDGERHDPGNPLQTQDVSMLLPLPEGYRAHTFEPPPNDRTP